MTGNQKSQQRGGTKTVMRNMKEKDTGGEGKEGDREEGDSQKREKGTEYEDHEEEKRKTITKTKARNT